MFACACSSGGAISKASSCLKFYPPSKIQKHLEYISVETYTTQDHIKVVRMFLCVSFTVVSHSFIKEALKT